MSRARVQIPASPPKIKPCILNGYRVSSMLFLTCFPLCFPLPASNQAFCASFSVEIKASIRAELSRFICFVTCAYVSRVKAAV